MAIALLAFLIGIVAGLRAFMAPAAVGWAAHGGGSDRPAALIEDGVAIVAAALIAAAWSA